MLLDLRAGLKPAMILALAKSFGDDLISADQATLKALLKKHKTYFKQDESGKQMYATTKSVSHGTNYMMTAPTMHMTIFRKTKAELYVPVPQCEQLRLLYLKRYPGLEKLYSHIPALIQSNGYLDNPCGMRRMFFGRNDNHRTRVGLSLLPQSNTAYATNRFLHNLYYMPYNRDVDGLSLHLAPMNQVHDEADLAFHVDNLEKVRSIVNVAADFDSEVWGTRFKIPFDPNYGDTWGTCEDNLFAED